MSRRRTSRAFTAANTDPFVYSPAYPDAHLLTVGTLAVAITPDAEFDVDETADPPHRLVQRADRWLVSWQPDLGVWATHPRPIGVWATPTRPRKFFATLAEAGDYARSRTSTT